MTPAVPAGAPGPVGRWQRGTAATAAIGELAARALSTDGVAPISGHVLTALALGSADWLTGDGLAAHDSPAHDPPEHDRLVDDIPAGALPAVAVVVDSDPAEVVVDPNSRRRGVGAALVRAAVDRQGGVWAYGNLPAAAAVADRLGLVPGRVLLQLRRSQKPGVAGQEPQLPSPITLRTFVPGRDEQSFLAVNAKAFAWHPEQGRLDLTGLRAEMAQPWFDPEGFFLAVRDGEVVGFHWTKVHPIDPTPGTGAGGADQPPRPVGEVYVIGVDPDAGIRGLGTALTTAGLAYLHRRGIDTVMLYVEGDNDAALRLYHRFGFGTQLTNVVYRRPAAPRQ